MLPFFSFILMWIGSLNWFFISAFQYDFVAGFFGTQSSLFSRFIYFFIGMAGFFMLFHLLKNKGKFSLLDGFKRTKNKAAVPIKVVEPSNQDETEEENEMLPNINYTAPKSNYKEPKAESGYKDFDVTKYD